jgi:hypothetical protein
MEVLMAMATMVAGYPMLVLEVTGLILVTIKPTEAPSPTMRPELGGALEMAFTMMETGPMEGPEVVDLVMAMAGQAMDTLGAGVPIIMK